MRKSNQRTIGEVIEQFLKENNLKKKIDEASIVNDWEKIMGKTINKYTHSIRLFDRKLLIELDSDVIKQEILFNKSKVIERINEHFGKSLVSELIIK